MNALLQLIPLAHKLIPDADEARKVAGQIHLAAINRIHEYAYSALMLVVGCSLMYSLHVADVGGQVNWYTFGVRFTLLMVLLGPRAKEVREYWKIARDIGRDARNPGRN